MERLFVSNKDESVRMFDNYILDKLSRVHYSVPILIYVPVMIYFMYDAIAVSQLQWTQIAGMLLFGGFVWTFTEYFLHRFVFHFQPSSDFGKKLHFLFHGVHHDYPNDSYRLVMVPTISLPLAFGLYFLFEAMIGPELISPFFVGLVFGYLVYDLGHYSFHHLNWKNKTFQSLKKHHMMHHYNQPEKGFGVSSRFWDYIFMTTYKK